jgi:hypothetical protein
MGDAFRDELEAAQQRADALEEERDELQRKVASLQEELAHEQNDAPPEASAAEKASADESSDSTGRLLQVAFTVAVLAAFAWILDRCLSP